MSKKNWIILAGTAVLIIVIASLSTALHYKIKENKRVRSNYDILIEQRMDEEQVLTRDEFKKYHQEYVELLKEYDIKVKNVEHVINTKYYIKDSTVLKEELVYYYDTIKNVPCSDFSLKDDCWLIEGKVCNDSTIEINNRIMLDSLLFSLYKEKKCFKKPIYKAIVISKCKGDTMQIIDNINIIKNKRKNRN